MTSLSFQKMATVTASIKRSPISVNGKRGVPVANLTGLKVLPIDPLDPEVQIRLELDGPFELLQTMVEDGPDINRHTDTLVVGTKEYKIRAVADWNWRPSGSGTLLLVLEKLPT